MRAAVGDVEIVRWLLGLGRWTPSANGDTALAMAVGGRES
jgi:hypothetical protein